MSFLKLRKEGEIMNKKDLLIFLFYKGAKLNSTLQ